MPNDFFWITVRERMSATLHRLAQVHGDAQADGHTRGVLPGTAALASSDRLAANLHSDATQLASQCVHSAAHCAVTVTADH